MTEDLLIRDFTIPDTDGLTELINELGYFTTRQQMFERITNIQNHMDHKTLIATLEHDVVGMIGLTKNISYENDGLYVRVLAVVTHSKFRNRGIGKKLMEAGEKFANDIGAHKILLNCGVRHERAVAHKFYENIGYQIKSSGFIKKLK